jgi:hypothetical protein
MSYAHYTRAGSGDILGINAPQAQFASVTQISADDHQSLLTPLPAQIIAVGSYDSKLLRHSDQGFPSGLVTSFNKATDNITYIPKNTKDSYVESYFLSVQRTSWPRTPCSTSPTSATTASSCRASSTPTRRIPQRLRPSLRNWPSDITEA